MLKNDTLKNSTSHIGLYGSAPGTKNHPVKITINGTYGTMLFSKGLVRLKITQSKLTLTVHRVQCYFPKEELDCKSASRKSFNSTQRTMIFSQEK